MYATHLENGDTREVSEALSCWNKVPMNISLTWCTPPVRDECTLVAGIIGYRLHGVENTDQDILEPYIMSGLCT
jgi:hypothetical protein